MLRKMHHIAIICSNYEASKEFYVNKLGLEILNEVYRETRQSYKLDLALNGEYILELFSFPNPPKRVTNPEATGLRHIAFEVDDIEGVIKTLKENNVASEPLRLDPYTDKKFTFLKDPDGLPIELYEL